MLRRVGTTSVHVTPIALGGMAHSTSGSDAERVARMQEAIDAGVTTIDTAPLYEFGRSEELVGQAIRGQRERVQVLTKVGLCWDSDHGEVLFTHGERVVRKDSRPEAVIRDVERSLERLAVETIDLIQVHHPDVSTPFDETFGALADLHSKGRVRAIGVSNFSVAQLAAARRALGEIPLASTQERYSLIYREVEDAVAPWCTEHEVSLLCFAPLAMGLLAGKLLRGGRYDADDWRSGDVALRPKNLARVHRTMQETLVPIAAAHGVSIATVALTWLRDQPTVGSVIAGARTSEHVQAAAQALSLELDASTRRRIRSAFSALRLDPNEGYSRRERARRLARRAVGKVGRVARRWLNPER